MKNIILLFAMPWLMACSEEILENEFGSSQSLEGSWRTPCTPSGSIYEIRDASFISGQFTVSSRVYADAGCSLPVVDVSMSGSYVLGGPISDQSESMKIDLTLASLLVKPLHSAMATDYNQAGYCGFTDWTVGVAKNTAGLVCDSIQTAAAGDVSYDIYHIVSVDIPQLGLVRGTMNMGYAEDGGNDASTPAKRPTSYDGNYNYRRR